MWYSSMLSSLTSLTFWVFFSYFLLALRYLGNAQCFSRLLTANRNFFWWKPNIWLLKIVFWQFCKWTLIIHVPKCKKVFYFLTIIFLKFELVFKASRNFSTRLTLSESSEIGSTHSIFDSKMVHSRIASISKNQWLSKPSVFVIWP